MGLSASVTARPAPVSFLGQNEPWCCVPARSVLAGASTAC